MWIIFGLTCALTHSLSDFYYRKGGEGVSTKVLALNRLFFTALILWIAVLFEGVPTLGPELWKAYCIGIPLELLATLLYLRAIQLSPLSISAPLFAFSPAFILITGPLFLGESSSLMGTVGVLFIVGGAYTLNLSKIEYGFFEPIKSLAKEKGAKFMLGAAFLFSITANMGRLGVLQSSPAFFGATYFSLLSLLLAPSVLFSGEMKRVFEGKLLLPGSFAALSVLLHLKGVELIQAGYFVAIKRMSLLFSIILGVLFLKELGGRERIIGGAIMLLGVVVILLLR